MSSDEQVIWALRILEGASLDSLVRFRGPITKTFHRINNKLAPRQSHAVALFQALSRKLKNIKAFLSRSEAEAVGLPSWMGIDPRLADVERLSSNSNDREKFRAFLAARSLALDEEAWEIRNYGSSRVNLLAAQPELSNDRNGYTRQFLNSMNFDQKSGSYAIKLGQKILVNERMFPGFSGSTALYAFCQDTFRRIPFGGARRGFYQYPVP
ncbi:hypothetical protein ACJ73_04920 [Blastomyces percursus]|uniref:Uncharacterized protein n=1 Tax=Blastomyces percursus TaxID=1658174 RepID=A0A1J9Q5G6_9EURO|nr:hypothetical protein ACJ73_04920 [Blastomyces percursus]